MHRAVSAGFVERGYHLGHVTGHSIGMTMIEFPKIGEGVETELREGMVFSMHPHAIAANGEDCLYMQETWLVTAGRRASRCQPADAGVQRVSPGIGSAPRWLQSSGELAVARAARLRGRTGRRGRMAAPRSGASARRRAASAQRKQRKAQLRVIAPEDEESDEFIRSVQRDLDALPTIEEHDRKT